MSPSSQTLPQKPDPFFSGTVYEVKGWRRWLLIVPGALLFRLYCATLRVAITEEERQALSDTSRPTVCIVWHNRSFLVPFLIRHYRKPDSAYCLISASKAAAWEDAIYHVLGLRSVRGSSTRRGIHAMLGLVRQLGNGNDIVISPDGPSGPRYEFKRGAAAAARMTNSPILLAGIESKQAWRPHTWDRQMYPLPFSKIRIRALKLEPADIFSEATDDEAACKRLAELLNSINEDFGV